MKKILLQSCLMLGLCAPLQKVVAQAPQQVNYQAVARNTSGDPLLNQHVGLRFSVHNSSVGGTVVYKETDTATTNSFGLFSVALGGGTPLTGTFAGINWGSGNKYLQVEVDAAGGTNYVNAGTAQLLSVPYALYAGNTTGWSKLGDAGTIDSVNFIGTTDSVALSLRVNNQPAGVISAGLPGYASYGYGSGNGGYSAAVGYMANHIDAGLFNQAIGYKALYTGGAAYSTAIGDQSLFSAAGTARNIAIGSQTLYADSSGSDNIAIGDQALYDNHTGSLNVGIGSSAMHNNITGIENVAMGWNALYANTIGNQNVAIGAGAFESNIEGNFNVAIGALALGHFSYHTGINVYNTYNTAIGYNSLAADQPTSGSNGIRNTGTGAFSLGSNTTGVDNVGVGYNALYSNTDGTNNVAVGSEALYYNTGGIANTGMGQGALFHTTTAQYNTAIGYNSGEGYDNGYNNVFVGANTDVTGVGYYNVIAMGQGTTVAGSSVARFGNSSTASYGGWADWSNISDGRYKKNVQENVPGIAFINKLRPVTYNLEATRLDEFLHKNSKFELSPEAKASYQQALRDKEKITYTGFIAQEVEEAANQLGFDFSGVDKPKSENDTYGLRYAEFVVPIIKGMQQQQVMIEQQNQSIENQNKVIEALKQEIANLKGR